MEAMKTKSKEIRFRATQITSHIINSLDTLDDTLFHQLRQGLLKRLHDKEASVRLQAVYGLGRLATEVDDDEDDEDSDSDDDMGGKTVLNKLLDVLQNDPSRCAERTVCRGMYSLFVPGALSKRHLQHPRSQRQPPNISASSAQLGVGQGDKTVQSR